MNKNYETIMKMYTKQFQVPRHTKPLITMRSYMLLAFVTLAGKLTGN